MHQPHDSLLTVDVDRLGAIEVRTSDWADCRLEGLRPALRLDGADRQVAGEPKRQAGADGATAMTYDFSDALLELRFQPLGACGVMLTACLTNTTDHEIVLNDVTLLGTGGGAGTVRLGANPRRVRILRQGNYWGHVLPLAQATAAKEAAAPAEPGGAAAKLERSSGLVWLAYDQDARKALLVGFVSSERWLGHIQMSATAAGEIATWHVGFDGGELAISGRQRIDLEPLVLRVGDDPWALLEGYADIVAERHHPNVPAGPIVSWCSWYPYRLGVTEDRVLANAQAAARRLAPLGLKIMEVDLGWETGNLPCAFEENERFPHGLKCLADQLQTMGLDLGVWKAPFTISEFDPLAVEHPEWLVQDETGKPLAYWEWFWEPHGKVFILDLTCPGAMQWLRQNVHSLTRRGVRYLKLDFIGCVSGPSAKRRNNRHMVAGGGAEAARAAAAVIRQAAPDSLILNCGGPEMPGTGHWPILYCCNDTGNTGFIGHAFQSDNYQTVACHLFKNRRWGVIQPSCLVVGLPGTIEDARLRATVAFLAGGQVDISDTLTTLPEDRWRILTATLPPLGLTAKPVDLFDPLTILPFDYEATCKGQKPAAGPIQEHPPGSVWSLHVTAEWDQWDLVGVFCYAPGSSAAKPEISRYTLPLARLGIAENKTRLGYEFWSGQFLGVVPGQRRNAGGYAHPGDYQDLTVGDAPGTLDIAFFGPGVKLICLRRSRPHPWVAGTSFHQSCGAELKAVQWNPATRTLSGELHRPVGEDGFIAISAAGMAPAEGNVDGQPAPLRWGANDSLILPMVVAHCPARWSASFR